MATLKTQGFALSALPRSPNIPANVGGVDVKEIYDGVRQGLAAFENVRRAPASMALADATMAAETAAAPLKTSILAETAAQAPLNTRRVLAQTQGVEEQTPLKTKQLQAETSPEFLDAKIKHLLLSLNPAGVREFDLLTATMSPEEKERARRIHFGIDPRTSGAAITYQKFVGQDGVERLVAVDPRAVGAQVIPTGERYGSGVSAPGTTPAPTGIAAPATGTAQPASTPPVSGLQSPSLAEKKTQETTAAKTAEMKLEGQAKLPKALSSLENLATKTDRVEKDIEEALQLSGPLTTGIGSYLKILPATDARKLEALLTSIRANIGFDTLSDMRQYSPTGGALGNVSDYESKTLQATIAQLDQALATGDLKEALLKVKEARREALVRTRNAFERDRMFFGLSDSGLSKSVATPNATGAAPGTAEFKIIKVTPPPVTQP